MRQPLEVSLAETLSSEKKLENLFPLSRQPAHDQYHLAIARG